MNNTLKQTTFQQDFPDDIKAAFCSEEHLKLLDAIDELRNLDIEADIPLPQIIVIGDQNAGKSSVLEAISGIPFPTKDGTATRCPIEVVLRRSPESRTTARLVARDHRQTKISFDATSFDKHIETLGEMTVADIPRVFELAADALGQRFTDDVLRIEVSGPEQQHLSLIDLPGFIKYADDAGDDSGEKLIEQLAERYMRNEQSIILAVISGKYDYRVQQTLKKVGEIDQHGARTMGVVTAIDIERDEELEAQFFKLASNKNHILRLGWHVLRNPSSRERQDKNFDRIALETTAFSVYPWSQIHAENRGSRQLTTKLSHILLEHVGRNIGDVTKAINDKIRELEVQLKQLGPHRTTLQQRQAYLFRIATDHGRLVEAGLKGHYEDPFYESMHQRLRAAVRKEFESFEQNMMTKGHKWEPCDESDPRLSSAGRIHESYKIPGPLPVEKRPILLTREEYLHKINVVLKEQRGLELPDDTNSSLIGTLFRDQSFPWRSLAEALVSRVLTLVSNFLHASIAHVTDPRRAHLIYQQSLRPALDAREASMKERLEELMKPLARAPTTYCALYSERLSELLSSNTPTRPDPDDSINRPACEKLMAQLVSFYYVTRMCFVDNVINLGIETCLLDDLDTIFCPSTLIDTWTEETDQLASDFPDDAARRSAITSDLARLKASREVCRFHDRTSFEQYSLAAPKLNEAGPISATPYHEPPTEASNHPEIVLSKPPMTPDNGHSRQHQTPSPYSSRSSGSNFSRKSATPSSAATTPPADGIFRPKPAFEVFGEGRGPFDLKH